jgi:hypothetical protein
MLATTATFSVAGEYVLRLTASDGQHTAHDDTTITVMDVVALEDLDVFVYANMTFTQLSGGMVRTTFNNCYIETDEGSWLDESYSNQPQITVRYSCYVLSYDGSGNPWDAGTVGQAYSTNPAPAFPAVRSIVNGKARFTFSGSDDTKPFPASWNVHEWAAGGGIGSPAVVNFSPRFQRPDGALGFINMPNRNENIQSGGSLPKTYTLAATAKTWTYDF